MHAGQHVDMRQLSALERAKDESITTASSKNSTAEAREEYDHSSDDVESGQAEISGLADKGGKSKREMGRRSVV